MVLERQKAVSDPQIRMIPFIQVFFTEIPENIAYKE